MKLIVTEEMFKKIVLSEAESDVSRIYSMQQAADRNPNAERGLKMGIEAANTAANPELMQRMRDVLSNRGNGAYNGTGTDYSYDGNYEGTLGDWDVGKSIRYLISHAQPKSVHLCATYVLKAIAAGGLPMMYCSENGGDAYAHALHHNGILKKHGFHMIDSGTLQPFQKYNGAQPGDIMISDTIRYSQNPHKNHAAMWTGNRWISDFAQNNANVYSGYPVDFWVYRYSGERK